MQLDGRGPSIMMLDGGDNWEWCWMEGTIKNDAGWRRQLRMVLAGGDS